MYSQDEFVSVLLGNFMFNLCLIPLGLLDELADTSTKRGLQHQRYLETVLQFKDKGYRFVDVLFQSF